MGKTLSLDRMIKKAYELIRERRIEEIEGGVYNVIGDHGTYTVIRNMDGSVTCNCLGFISKKKCSHSLAIIMLNNPALLEGVGKAIEREEKKRKTKR